MGFSSGVSQHKAAELSFVVVRADGSREDLGVVSYYNKNPIKRAIFKIKTLLGIKTKSSIGNN